MMTPKIFVALLLLVLLTGVCPQRPREVYVKAGEMASLLCPHTGHQESLTWTSHILPEGELDLTKDMSSADPGETGLLAHGRSLVVLNASMSHQGKYSCSLGKRSRRFWFRLTVLTTQSPGVDPRTTFSQTCFTTEACTLRCPAMNTPAPNMPNMTENDIVWHKAGDSKTPHHISTVEEKDSGVYTCNRSYLYHGHMYYMTFAVALDVQPGGKRGEPVILSPQANHVFKVDLGSSLVIDCRALMYSEFDEVFWLSGDSFVDKEESLPVYYNHSSRSNGTQIQMTASLVFREVSAADLLKRYTCKLESDSHPPTFVTVSLAQKASLAVSVGTLCTAAVIVTTATAAVLYRKVKKGRALSQRGPCVCCGGSSDKKSPEALLMTYTSDAEAGTMELDRKWLKGVLEERFGYAVYECDVSRGKAAAGAAALSECIKRSSAVILLPTSSDGCLESGLLSANHLGLMKHKSLVLIKTESTATPRSEKLQLLANAGHCVTWKGSSSMSPSSSFWKELQCHLPISQQTQARSLLKMPIQHES